MKSIDYWSAREARQREQNRREERNHAKELRRIYQDMLDGAQREIDAFFRRYGDAEGLTLAEARRRVSQTEIEAYERRAARYVRERDFSPEANAAMRLYNLTMRVNRLELLKASAGLELVSGYDELSRYFDQALTGRTLAEFSRQAGILGNTVQDPAQRAQAIVGASFHNATWSERIWRQQDALRETLSTLLTRGLALGQGSTRLARDLRERFSVSRSDAERLMSTELRRVQTAAAQESYQRNGNDRYVFLALNPQGPCPVCRALHEQSFPVSELMPGENAPPMHPRCHCSTAPDWDEAAFQRWLEEERRRNRAGRSILHTTDDPIREILGSAFQSHPKETQEILEELRKKGIEVTFRDGVMGYMPSPTPGKGGQIVIDPEASYSAWLHERQHVYDDEQSGWMGFRNFQDPEVAAAMEDRAYDVEIAFAEKMGYNDIVKRLKRLKSDRYEGVTNHERREAADNAGKAE